MITTEIKNYLSGGVGNSNPNISLGGVASSTVVVDNTLNNLFAYAPASESLIGSTKYRAFFVKNTHATLTAIDTVIYISTNTPSLTTDVKIALANETGSPIELITNEDTAPAIVTFSTASGVLNALSIGDLAPGETKGIWVKWTIGAATTAVIDSATISIRCETEA